MQELDVSIGVSLWKSMEKQWEGDLYGKTEVQENIIK